MEWASEEDGKSPLLAAKWAFRFEKGEGEADGLSSWLIPSNTQQR